MSNTQKSIVSGMTVLSLVGVICKIVGALYRIPLAWLIGDEGMGTYQLVFPTYNMLLTISSAGLPVAISRMVSYSLAKDDPRSAKRIFRVALCLLTALGFIAMLLMIVMSPTLAQRSGDLSTQPGFVAIAPALLLVCVMSALRGFMQGQQNMVPTAISQLIEQVGKVFVALPLAWLGSRVSIAYAAAGVLLGTSLAEAAALLYMVIVYHRKKATFAALPQSDESENLPAKSLLRRLLSLSIPITLGACIVPIASFIDSGLLLNRLVVAGIPRNEALGLYGRYSGYVLTLINVPTALATAIAMSLVPSISGAMARGDGKGMRHQSALGLRLSFVVGLPCSIGMSMLSKQLLDLVYHFDTPEALQVTANLLSISSLTIVLFTVVQSTSGILQGLRKQRIPMYTLMLGVAVKIFLNYTLIGTPSIHIYGAPIASLACYTLSMVPNLFYVRKYTGMKLDLWNIAGKPALATAVMALVLFGSMKLLPTNGFWALIQVCIGAAAYAGAALMTGAVSRDDLAPILRRFGRKGSPKKED
ncbi:MAG: polysaccharide biosynthesis protein [Clostridiales bacterium]|nr:polysaccharide biosynthesis protein [Clostridiales bacterium]